MISFPDHDVNEYVEVDDWLPQLRTHVQDGNTVKSGMEQIIYRIPELTTDSLKEVIDMGWDINELGEYYLITGVESNFHFKNNLCTPLASIIRKSVTIKNNGLDLESSYPDKSMITMMVSSGADPEIRTECNSIYDDQFFLSMVDLVFVSDEHNFSFHDLSQLEKYVELVIDSETIERYINGSLLNLRMTSRISLIKHIGSIIKDVSGRKIFNEEFEKIQVDMDFYTQNSPGYISIRGNGVNCDSMDQYFYKTDYYRWTEDMLREYIIKKYKMVPEDGLDRTDLQDIISEKDDEEVMCWSEEHYESVISAADNNIEPYKIVEKCVNSRGLLHNNIGHAYSSQIHKYESFYVKEQEQFLINGVLQ
jgi:hypothetical protein